MTKPADLPVDLDLGLIEQTLRDAAAAAARVTLPLFRADTSVDNKHEHGFDPVTRADRESETAIREVISQSFSDHNIVGEEHPDKTTQSPFTWTIDPIDGTRAFISGLPVWGTLIGVSHEGRNFAGLMSQPFTGEIHLAIPGKSWLEHGGRTRPNRVRTTISLGEAIMFTTTPALFPYEYLNRFRDLEHQVQLSRYGTDCYAYTLLAGGHIDLVVEMGLHSFDIAGLIPIIENAGGIVTDFSGRQADQGGSIIAAATPELHAAAMDILGD